MSQLLIQVTGDCQLSCGFCDLRSGQNLSIDTIMQYVDASKLGHINLSGGEPFLRKDLTEIVVEIVERGKTVQIATTGTIMPDDFMRLDEETRKKVSLQISLHAASKEAYAQITGKDQFDKVMHNLPYFAGAYFTGLNCAVSQGNYGEVAGVLEIAYKHGLPVRFNLVLPNAGISTGTGSNGQLLTPEQVEELREQLQVEKILSNGLVDSPLLHPNTCPVVEQAYGIPKTGRCHAETGQKLYVDAKGKEHKCEFWGG